ncbi:MAG: hypothetical protein PHX83_13885 [Acidobacteriia bacterium]|nr:hypothetical protein [Terriglobia bacterium]
MNRRDCRFLLFACSLTTFLLLLPNMAAQDRAHDLAGQAGAAKAAKCQNVQTMRDCHDNYPTGCNTAAMYDAYLNFLKNQKPDPSLSPESVLAFQDFTNLEKKIPSGLSSNNHASHSSQLADLGEGNIQALVGYLYAVKQEKNESCNCQLTDPDAVDFHMWVGFDASSAVKVQKKLLKPAALAALKKKSIIVEMTPHYRAEVHPKWTYQSVSPMVGRQVKVVGQLLLDNDHYKLSQDCGMSGASKTQCWRATVWELHPVIQFYVCAQGTACAADSSAWKSLDDMLP